MHPSKMLPKPETTQTISFSEGDGVYSSEVFASDVMVTTNAGTHNHGSSKVKLKSIVELQLGTKILYWTIIGCSHEWKISGIFNKSRGTLGKAGGRTTFKMTGADLQPCESTILLVKYLFPDNGVYRQPVSSRIKKMNRWDCHPLEALDILCGMDPSPGK
ncbi:hypothetical protein EVAR_52488_1 [Eumeta japonica]|uniref:Uncharacterized protein n=1 Tax=Eumeta variegata TaxID=151549 RepID=A0A4C1ZHH8_EUMVA|nr:hypothetical protein EVAR_52488_1 [Eumeta japonica]